MELLLSAFVLVPDHLKLVEKGYPRNVMVLPRAANLFPRILDLFSKRIKLVPSTVVGLFCNALKSLHEGEM